MEVVVVEDIQYSYLSTLGDVLILLTVTPMCALQVIPAARTGAGLLLCWM